MKSHSFFSRLSTGRPRRDRNRNRRIASLEALEGRIVLSTYIWNNPTSGNFDTAADWNGPNNTHAVPGPGDDVDIPQGDFTVSVTQDTTVNSIQGFFGGGVSVLSGTLTVTNAATALASTIDALTVASGASFVTAGGTTTLENGGVVNGNLDTAAGATLIFSDTASFPGALETGTTLTGAGTFEVTSYLFIDTAITAPTHLELNSGNSDGIDGTGTLTVPSGATLDWQSGSMQGLGGSTVISQGANLTIDGAYSGYGDYLIDRALVNSGSIIESTPMTLNVNNAAVLTNSGTFAITNDGPIAGNGIIDNSGTLTKTSPSGVGTTQIGPTFNNSGAVVASSGILQFNGGGIDTGLFNDPSSVGSIDVTGTGYDLNSGATFLGTGSLELDSGNGVSINSNLTIPDLTVDNGTIEGAGSLTVTGILATNNANINITGTLTLPSGSGLTINGASQTTTFDNVTVNDAGTTTLSGTDDFALNGTTVFTNSGTFTIANDQNSSGGNFSLNNATFRNTGVLEKTTPSGPSGLSNISGGIFNNSGTVNALSGQLELQVTSTNTGTLEAQSNAALLLTGTVYLNVGTTLGGTGLIDNGNPNTSSGTININANVSTSNFTFVGATLYVNSGAIFTPTLFNFAGGSVTGTGAIDIPTNGVVTFSGAAGQSISGTTLAISGTANETGTGSIQLNNGAVIVVNPSGTFNATSDETINGGSGGTFNIYGHFDKTSLTGVGTTTIGVATNILTGGSIDLVSGDLATQSLVNVGTITLGSQTVLNITGTYTQPNAGTLNIAVGGTPASALFGQLNASSTGSLNGSLNVTRANNYLPTVGSVYPIMTFSSRIGAFTNFVPPYNGIANLYNGGLPSNGVNLIGATSLPKAPTSLTIYAPDDTGGPGVTAVHQPRLTGMAQPNLLIQLYDQHQNLVGSTFTNANGVFVVPLFSALAPGTYVFTAVAIDLLSDYSPNSTALTVTITPPPPAPTGLTLYPADDTGGPGSTSNLQPRLTGTATAGDLVQIFEVVGNTNVYVGYGYAAANGTFVATPANKFSVGVHILKAVAIDAGGNYGASSTSFTLNIT